MSAPPLLEIIRGLFIGNEVQAASRGLLIEHNVKYVVNAAACQVNNHFIDFDFEYLPLDLYDTTSDDVTQFFDATYDFIEKSQITEQGCIVHCKSGNSRAAAIIMMYLMRKFSAPLKEVFRYVLVRTACLAKPNAGFLAQLMDYEVEMLGKSSFEDNSGVETETVPVLTIDRIGFFLGSQGALDNENDYRTTEAQVKLLLSTGRWTELSKLNEQFIDNDFGPFPKWDVLLRRCIYSVVCMQLNIVVERIPVPNNPTALLVHNYIEKTGDALSVNLGSSLQRGYLHALNHAVTYTLSVANVGVGSIFIDHLSQRFGLLYKQLHTGKVKAGPGALDTLSEDVEKDAAIVFNLFKYLRTDASLVNYLTQYETSLATRLTLFLPIAGHSPTAALLPLEEAVADLIPHPGHAEIVKKMLADITKVPELRANWEASLEAQNTEATTFPKLEVALLDASAWPLSAVTKPFTPTTDTTAMPNTIGNIPTTVLPLDIFPAWNSFRDFIEADENGRRIVLLPTYGDAQLAATFENKQYIFDVTTPMMLVLCCFNDHDGSADSFSYKQIHQSLNLPPKVLTQALYSLSQPSHQILTRSSATDALILDNEIFCLNKSFTSKLRKIKVPNIKYPHK